ncbi:MAG TPA: Gfo/Idh/MocA family oxidoreductase [Planctomycetaceae bacterium]|nr:Gfo/Idh/MocA family oxidoreductase [Planctomycetaceae bacterium]
MGTNKMNRRQFAKRAASGALSLTGAAVLLRAGLFAAESPAATVTSRSPNDKLNIAIIGAGGRGGANMRSVAGENIVALCDVDENALRRAAQQAPRAKQFRDFRQLYDELADSEFDAVVVSTTEHTHAFATLPALERKKHVYCEKPLTRDVREARIITEAARQAGVATQMGTQVHASSIYRRVVELVQSGAIGPVREVHVWVSRAWGRQTREEAGQNRDLVWTWERPTDEMSVPDHLDWDLWLGPAPERPFHEVYVPGPKWYRWWDFGNGTMSDLGSHWIDLPFWALDLDAPRTIAADGPEPHAEIAPASMSATYEYGPRGDRPGLVLTWYQGTMKPKLWTEGRIPAWPNGVLFVGESAMLLADYGKYLLLVEDRGLEAFSPFERPKDRIPESLGHHAEWIHACKTGSPTTCHFGYSGPLTEANHLGNVAYRAGRKLEWDAASLRIPNAPQAEQFLGREYRAGWRLA